MSQLSDLLSLQALDDEALSLATALADAERRLQENDELEAARRALAAAEQEVDSLRRHQRSLDAAVADLTTKVRGEDKRLYDGSIKNPKELAGIQRELDVLKSRLSTLEDEALDLLSRLEDAERDRQSRTAEAARLENRWGEEQARLSRERDRLQNASVAVTAKRAAQAAALKPTALALYEQIRSRRGSNAVAHIKAGACTGCRISLPDAVRRRVLAADAIVQCPNCERILVVG